MTSIGAQDEKMELDTTHLPLADLLADPPPVDSIALEPPAAKASRKRRKRNAKPAAAPIPVVSTLSALRDRQGLSQKQVASLMGIQQANVSRLESRGDVCLSSLKNYIGAMGGEIEIVARIGPDVFTLLLEDTQGLKRPRKRKSINDDSSRLQNHIK